MTERDTNMVRTWYEDDTNKTDALLPRNVSLALLSVQKGTLRHLPTGRQVYSAFLNHIS